MKKLLLILGMLMMSVMAFANGTKITSEIKLGMKRSELEKAIDRKYMEISEVTSNGDGLYFYEKVKDPLGIEREIASFNFVDKKLVSAIFDDRTTDAEHKKIYNFYLKNRKTLFKGASELIENDTKTSLLLYNDEIVLLIDRGNVC